MASRRHARSRFRARSVIGAGRGRQIQSVDGGIQRVNVGWCAADGMHAALHTAAATALVLFSQNSKMEWELRSGQTQ